MDYYRIGGPLLRQLPAEWAHNLAIWALRFGLLPNQPVNKYDSLRQTLWGRDFAHPIGMAAGFDKNAQAVMPLFTQGFSFVEVGTMTPRPQPGNPRPRLFRLPEDQAVINRLGFNNAGLDAAMRRLRALPKRRPGVVGCNIGKNRTQADAVQDYVAGVRAVHAYADYIAINISSPNTAGLRALQQEQALSDLLRVLRDVCQELNVQHQRVVPLLLKIAPDLEPKEQEALAQVALEHAIDGMIVSNTTIARPSTLRSAHRHEQGGLSGVPLMQPSTQVLAAMYRYTQGRIPLIGVGGVASAEDAYRKIKAGAHGVQLYSALVYQGFALVPRLVHGLVHCLKRDGFSHITQAIGTEADNYTV